MHRWVARYLTGQIAGLADGSHRPHSSPAQVAGVVEVAVAEMRRGHPKWGPRRLVFGVGRRGRQVTHSSVYRTLVRSGLVEPKSRRLTAGRGAEGAAPLASGVRGG